MRSTSSASDLPYAMSGAHFEHRRDREREAGGFGYGRGRLKLGQRRDRDIIDLPRDRRAALPRVVFEIQDNRHSASDRSRRLKLAVNEERLPITIAANAADDADVRPEKDGRECTSGGIRVRIRRARQLVRDLDRLRGDEACSISKNLDQIGRANLYRSEKFRPGRANHRSPFHQRSSSTISQPRWMVR